MHSGLPLHTSDCATWPLATSSDTNQRGAQLAGSTSTSLACSSSDYGALAGRTENGSTAPPFQTTDVKLSPDGSSHHDETNIGLKMPAINQSHQNNATAVPVQPVHANANEHPCTCNTSIETKAMQEKGQEPPNYPILSKLGQSDDSHRVPAESQGGNLDAQPHSVVSKPDEGSEDLSAFLPLGVLDSKTGTEKYAAEISILEGSSWIRARVKNDSTRIYVDPKLTRRNNVQKSIKKLRAAFKILMSNIDASEESWEGRRKAITKDSDDDSDKDESLWYIFNTLQDPDPRPDLIKDKWSQQAALDLLSGDDFSEFGLKTPLHPYQRRSAAAIVQREVQPAQVLDPRLQAYRTPTGKEYYYDREDACIFLEKALYSEACGGVLSSNC